MKSESRTRLTTLLFLLIIVCCSIAPFWQGISGPFLLDDNENLSLMDEHGGIKDLSTLLAYITNTQASSFGRPLAYLSFALNSQTAPSDPYYFKLTNIVLHAVNSIIVFFLCYLLFRHYTGRLQNSLNIAFLSALIWAVHPIQISTVLYVVQRMTELAALFMFAGVAAYIHARTRANQDTRAVYIAMSSSVLIFGSLAFISKENGALLPLLILVVEMTLLSGLPRPKYWRYWAIPFLAIPVLIIFSYLGLTIINSAARYASREFTIFERAITETRVIFDYLYYFILPLNTPNLFHDDFIISRGLLKPYTTLLSLSSIIFLMTYAILNRSKHPILSFSILWFLASHLLESTVIPLEIYFEHRNYTALLGPAIGLGYLCNYLLQNKFKIYLPVISLIIASLIGLNFKHSQTWGDNLALLSAWSDEHPYSVRTQLQYSNDLYLDRQFDKAVRILEATIRNNPDHLGARIYYTTLSCNLDLLKQEDITILFRQLASNKVDNTVVPNLIRMSAQMRDGNCMQIPASGLEKIARALLGNKDLKKIVRGEHSLYLLIGELNLGMRRFELSRNAFTAAYEIEPSISIALRIAQLHAAAGDYDTAVHYVDNALNLDKDQPGFAISKRDELLQIRKELLEMQKNQSNP